MAAVFNSLFMKSGIKSDSADETAASNGSRKNKQRVLMLSSRGVTHRHRHLMSDLIGIMPHARKENKFDSKKSKALHLLNELAEICNCNNVLYFEARKGQDLYLWASKAPNGPTVKLFLQNLHTIDELHFTGNCLKGSRPILSFDSAFDKDPYLKLVKEIFTHVFGIPPGQRRSKPFIDRVLSFSVTDGKLWVRHYEIREVDKVRTGEDAEEAHKAPKSKGSNKAETDVSLVEIGPRFVLTPIIIQEGSFGGPILYENKRFVSPNQVRSGLRKAKATRHNIRLDKQEARQERRKVLGTKTAADGLDIRQVFA